MSSVFLSPAISIELFLELFLLLILSYAFVQTILIIRNYKLDTITDIKLYVEKKSYLVSVLLSLALVIKILLMAFYVYALDALSDIVPGAMCVTGVLNTNEYGKVMMFYKLFVLLSVSLWLMLNKADLHSSDGRYFLQKMRLYLGVYFLIVLELIIVLLFLSNIDTNIPVSCCSAKVLDDTPKLPFGLSDFGLLALFYGSYALVVFSVWRQKRYLLLISTLALAYFAYYALTYYFSGYIYEIPLHHCPYCMLQQDYNFIGYFLYASFFLFVFYSFSNILFFQERKEYMKSLFWLHFFIFLISSTLLF